MWGGYCFHVVRPSITFWFLLILLNNLRNLFTFCIKVGIDKMLLFFTFCIKVGIDKMLLLHKNKGLIPNRIISLCNS